MKKLFLFAVMMMAVLNAKAQLKVDSLGKVGIGSVPENSFKVSVLATMGGIKSVSNLGSSASGGEATGISGMAYIPYHGMSYGVKGVSNASGNSIDGKSIGVYGYAQGANLGGNYGVFGFIAPHENGAGIYGSSELSNDTGPVIQGRYAGYFNGDVYVTGNMSVSGTFLYSSNNLYRLETDNNESNGVQEYSERLQNVSVDKYGYHPNLTDIQDRSLSDYESELSFTEKQAVAKLHYGLNAEQLEEVFPDLVYENEDGAKSINYVEMVPILVQAINELSAKVEMLEGESTAKKTQTRATNANEMGDNLVMLSLGQNKPNPFGTTTSIDVSIPESVQKAFIYVYDLQGKKVDQVDITARGRQTVQLNAATLSDGMYLYSLIADGKVVETRRMIGEK